MTITSVGRTGDKHIQLAANGSLVGYQRRLQGHVFGMCNPLYDIPRLLELYRDGQLKLDEADHPAVPAGRIGTLATRTSRTARSFVV